MREANDDDSFDSTESANYSVGFCRPPLHTRFKPGQSGNPSGRVKGSKNFKSLFQQILNEQIALHEGSESRKITKAEAIMRRLVLGALKGDSRTLMTLMRIAEATGQFDEASEPLQRIERIIITGVPRAGDDLAVLPGSTELNRDEP